MPPGIEDMLGRLSAVPSLAIIAAPHLKMLLRCRFMTGDTVACLPRLTGSCRHIE
jgi:hypothetical protein